MGIFDAFFTNSQSIGKGFELLSKGKSYMVAYGEDGEVAAYTTGISAGDKLMDKYIENSGIDKANMIIQEEFHKDKDGFIAENGDRQICIVDKTLMLKKDVVKMMESIELIPDKTNRWMNGLDKYTSTK